MTKSSSSLGKKIESYFSDKHFVLFGFKLFKKKH